MVRIRFKPEEEAFMTNAVDKKTETPKQQPKTANPSELAKTKKESDVELTEDRRTWMHVGVPVPPRSGVPHRKGLQDKLASIEPPRQGVVVVPSA
jgi:hypothetical protein